MEVKVQVECACIQGDDTFDSDNDGLVGLQEFALALAMCAFDNGRCDGVEYAYNTRLLGRTALVGRS